LRTFVFKFSDKMKKRNFDTWTFEEVELMFGINRLHENFALLEKWLAAKHPLTQSESDISKLLRFQISRNADTWNEDELKFFFIGPLVAMIGYDIEQYKGFTQRPMSQKFEALDLEVAGRVEFLLARGRQTPRQPFFCLHEYKQENRRDNDPLGQLLVSMVVAQTQNEKNIPIYGSYVSGRSWFFVVLFEKEYAVSRAFDSTQEADFIQIFNCLSDLKVIIPKLLAV
jgi:hypothetical protein